MKANELRIGNMVNDGVYKLMWAKPAMPYEEANEMQYGVAKDNEFTFFKEKELEPIPLTEEWLVKFGAEKVNEISEYFDGEDMYSYELYLDGAECLFDRKCNCQPYEHIKYVHQLQNLYFALTGEELKQNVTENV